MQKSGALLWRTSLKLLLLSMAQMVKSPLLFLQPKLSHLHLLKKLKLGEAQESVAKMEGLGTIVVPARIAWPVLPHLQA
jgi:presenilin-like A22 family membrane protease